MHNYYSFLYNKMVFDLLKEERGEGEAMPVRPQRHRRKPAVPRPLGRRLQRQLHFHGRDPARRPEHEPQPASASGATTFPALSSTAPADVYKRWAAFGLLSSHSRLHGSSSYRVPWLFDEESCDVVRKFTRLKCRLMPYLYGAAVEAHEHRHAHDAPHDAGIPR